MSVYYSDNLVTLHEGTALDVAADLEPSSVRTIVTSPPYYGLRDYGHEDQIGGEASVTEYVESLVQTFRALRPALTNDGTLWLNLGDSYTGSWGAQSQKVQMADRAVVTARAYGGASSRTGSRRPGEPPAKNLLGVPWRVAFALQADGWILRSDIIWAKPNPMPESVTDRPSKAHEYLGRTRPVGDRTFTGKRNKRTVWTVPTVPFPGAHFATYPPELIRPCILAGSARGDTVLDPFSGSGTTGMVATQEGRRYIGIDVNAEYLDLSLRERFSDAVLDMTGGGA